MGFMDKVKGLFGQTTDAAGDAAHKAKDVAGDMTDKAKDVAEDVKDRFDGEGEGAADAATGGESVDGTGDDAAGGTA